MPLTADDPMTKLGGRIHAGTGGGWMERRPKPADRHALRSRPHSQIGDGIGRADA